MRHIVRLTKVASNLRWHTKNGKKIVRDTRRDDTLRFDIAAGAGQIRVIASEQSEVREATLASTPIEIIRQANRAGIEDVCVLAEEHKPIGLWIRKRPE